MTHSADPGPASRGRKPLVLHIGLQKTGTSSIQVMLAGSAGYLAEAGFCYPALPPRADPAAPLPGVWTSPFRHNCLVAGFADFPSTFPALDATQDAAFWEDLRASDRVPILSAEEFSRLADLTPLAARLAGFEVHLVVYLRRQDAWAESLYNQRNKILLGRGDPRLLAGDLLSEASLFGFLHQERFARLLRFDRLLDDHAAALAPGRITVRVFDRGRLTGGDVCRDFAEVLGLDPARLTLPGREANGSIANDLLRLIVARFEAEGEGPALEMMRTINAVIGVGHDFSGDYRILSDRTRQHFLRQYADGNARIAGDHGVSLD